MDRSQSAIDISPDEFLEEYFPSLFSELKVSYDKVEQRYPDYDPLKDSKTIDTSAWRPKDEDNQHNGWYYRCSISKGTSGVLSGKKIVIKDNIQLKGVPMMVGSALLQGYLPSENATIVNRILDAGGEIIGKGTCEELCISGASYSTLLGPVRNSLHPAYSAGGSSSGCAVLVQTGEADIAVGSDQGGSIRNPASSCGIVGMKPTFSLVPFTGALLGDSFTDTLGPLARNVDNCALLLSVIGGPDIGADSRQTRFNALPISYERTKGPTFDLRLATLNEGFGLVQKDLALTVAIAIERVRSTQLFAGIDSVSIPIHSHGADIHNSLTDTNGSEEVFGNAGLSPRLYGQCSVPMTDHLGKSLEEPAKLSKLTYLAKLGFLFHQTNPFQQDDLFRKAYKLMVALQNSYDEIFKKYDIIMMPTLPRTPVKLPHDSTSIKEQITATHCMRSNTSIFNLTGHPALTLACSRMEGSPFFAGLQVVGRRGEDETVLRAARQIEAILEPLVTSDRIEE